jgi:NTE family protein
VLEGNRDAKRELDEEADIAYRNCMVYRLALVLGGGGVRCMAHVGVFIELERAGIIPDLIVGSSIGSVMGGVYAYKKDADFLWDFAFRFAKNPVVRILERYMSREPGRLSRISTSIAFSLGLAYISWQYGFLSSDLIKKAYRDILGSKMLRSRRFNLEDCEIPFAPLATDIETARAVILTRGDIPNAMYASCALPGICKPYRLDQMSLLDGGIVSLVPVMAAHILGAERIIAVDTDAKLHGYGNIVEMLEQASAIRGYRWNMMETGLADLVIKPMVFEHVWYQFSQSNVCIMAGKKAAREEMDKIKELISREPNREKIAERSYLAGYYPHVIV